MLVAHAAYTQAQYGITAAVSVRDLMPPTRVTMGMNIPVNRNG